MSGGEYGKLYKRAWGDPDFRHLNEGEQALYQKLLSQTDISLAGVLTYAPVRWAGQTSGLSVKDIEKRFKSLVDRRYILWDEFTQEVLVRSYIRHDLGWRSPRTMIGIANAIHRILSGNLQLDLVAELLRLDTSDLSEKISESTGRSTKQVVESVIGDLVREIRLRNTPTDTVSDTPSDTPSHTVSASVSATNTTAPANTPAPANAPANTMGGRSAAADAAPPTKGRGSRLPDDWEPEDSEANQRAASDRTDDWITDQLDRFRDYWHAKSGKDAAKLDWDATWRNWLKKAKDYEGPRPRGNYADAAEQAEKAWKKPDPGPARLYDPDFDKEG